MTADKLPDGWAWTTLGKIIWRSQNGFSKRHSTAGTPTPVLRLANVSEHQIRSDDLRHIGMSTIEREKYLLERGDLLIIRVNGSKDLVGQPILFEEEGNYAFCDHFIRYSLINGLVLPQYVSLYLRDRIARNHIEFKMVSTAGQNTISQSSLATLPIALPPLSEQRRIVAKIETLLAQSRRGREALEAVPGLLARFRQAVLAAAFRGELTGREPDDEPASVLLEHIRAERRRRWEERLRAQGKDPTRRKYKEPAPPDTSDLPELPEGWAWTTVEEVGDTSGDAVLTGPFGAQLPSSEFVDEGVPVLAIGNVQWSGISTEKLNHVTEKKAAELGRYKIRAGDVLFTRSGTVGRAAVVPPEADGWLISYHLLRVRVDQRACIPDYLYLVFRGEMGIQEEIAERARGATRAGFNTMLLKTLPMPLAPLAEQRRIVARIEALFAQADILEAQVEACRRRLEQVDQAVLARAFRGELVPQDPDDEPASVLLERIRKEREGNGEKQARQMRLPAT